MLLLIKKHTDTLVQQKKFRPQEILEFVLKKQMQSFSFSPPINSVEEGKGFIGVSSFACKSSVFNTTNKNNLFSITVPETKPVEKTVDELKKLSELRSQNGIELHVEQVRKTGMISIKDYSLSSRDSFKNGILEKIKNVNYNELEHLV